MAAEKKGNAQVDEKKPDLGLLEEDDEFEEFPAEGIKYEKFVLEIHTPANYEYGCKNRLILSFFQPK